MSVQDRIDAVLDDLPPIDGLDPYVSYAFRDCANLPPEADPYAIAVRVLDFPEHTDIAQGGALIDFMFRLAEKNKGGRRVIGMCYCKPAAMGDLQDLFADLLERRLGRMPDFLVLLDWQYWVDATPRQREILVHHELCHAGQARDIFGGPRFTRDGLPVWAIKAHDLEEFNASVRRYGMPSPDVEAFLAAISENIEGGDG